MSSPFNIAFLSRESMQNPVILAGLVVVALAIAAVAGSAGKLASTLLFDPEPKPLAINSTPTSSAIDPAGITNRNFFGLASDKPTVALESLPETKLELTLRGAFAAADENEAGAIIEDDKQVAAQYNVGDELPGNATLNAIYPDRVVLSRNGLLETLYFPVNDFSDEGVGTRVNRSASSAASAAAPVNDPDAEKRREAIRKRIRELRGR